GFDAANVVARELSGSSVRETLNKSLANRCLHVQVSSAKVEFAKLPMKIVQHFRRRLTGSDYRLQEEKRIENAVTFGDMALDADAARLFSTNQDVVIQHQVGDVLESNRRLVEFEMVGRSDPL